MKKIRVFLLSCVLVLNGSVSAVFAEGDEPQTEEQIQEVQSEQTEEVFEEKETETEPETELAKTEERFETDEEQEIEEPAEEEREEPADNSETDEPAPQETSLPVNSAEPEYEAEEQPEADAETTDRFAEEEPEDEDVIAEEAAEELETVEEETELLNASVLDRLPLSYEEYKTISDEEVDEIVEAWYAYALKKYCYRGLTDLEKAENITKCVAEEFVYDNRFGSSTSMILMGGGTCWGSTNLINSLAYRAGLTSHIRNGNYDGGAGSAHRNAIFKIGNSYYVAEAGFASTTKPRGYTFHEEPYALTAYITVM